MTSRSREFFDLGAHARPSVGDTKTSVVGIDHLGWLLCDGRTLNISEWPTMFEVIGYAFGSNNSNTFKLPLQSGRVPGFITEPGGNRGIDSNENILSLRSLGDVVGEEDHTLTVPELATHNHGTQTALSNIPEEFELTGNSATGITMNEHTHGMPDIPNGTQGGLAILGSATAADEVRYTGTTGATTVTFTDPTHNHTLQPQGSNIAHNTMQPTLFIGNLFIYSGRPFYPATGAQAPNVLVPSNYPYAYSGSNVALY